MGNVSRFQRGKQVARYVGLFPRDGTSRGRQKLGAISKQGNRLLRCWLVEAAQIAVRYDPQFRREYLRRCHQKPKGVAKVAAARKLAVRLYWMLRTQTGYLEIVSHREEPTGALWVPRRRRPASRSFSNRGHTNQYACSRGTVSSRRFSLCRWQKLGGQRRPPGHRILENLEFEFHAKPGIERT